MSTNRNWCLESYRPLLKVQARQLQQNRRLLVKFDWSDLVQQTLLEAHRDLDKFKGKSEGELIQWLLQILANTALDRARHDHANGWDVDRERSLERTLRVAVDDSSLRLDNIVAGYEPSPSENFHKQELLVHLAEAIEQLLPAQRDVFISRDLLGKSINQIATDLELTEKAVAGLLLRARRKLRKLLKPFEVN